MPDIKVATADGRVQRLVDLGDGSVAPVYAAAYGGAGVISDSTFTYRFDVNSLPSAITYDSEGNQTTIMYGPDQNGRYIMQTSTWGADNKLLGDSAWQLTNADGDAVDGKGNVL